MHVEDEDTEKAIILWLNSTLGFVIFAGHRVPTRGPWVQFKKPVLNDVPLLNTDSVSPDSVQILASAYNQLAEAEILPLPHMSDDPVRIAMDEAVSKALDLPPLDGLRRLLAVEPIVCAKSLAEQRGISGDKQAGEADADVQFSLSLGA